MHAPELLEDLRRRCVEHPEDREAHAVFSDALMGHGDALGYYLRACLDGETPELTEGLRRRILGRLAPAASHVEVRYGFLREVTLSDSTVADFRKLAGLEEWSGVTSLTLPWRRRRRHDFAMPTDAVLRLIQAPCCRALRVVRNLSFATLQALAGEERHFDALAVSVLPEWGVNTPLPRAALSVGTLTLLSNFFGYGGSEPTLAWLKTWGRPLLDRVGQLQVHDFISAEELQLLLQRPGARLREVSTPDWSATRAPSGWHLSLRPLGDGLPGGCSLALVERRLARFVALLDRVGELATSCSAHVPRVPTALLAPLQHAAGKRPLRIEWEESVTIVPEDEAPF